MVVVEAVSLRETSIARALFSAHSHVEGEPGFAYGYAVAIFVSAEG